MRKTVKIHIYALGVLLLFIFFTNTVMADGYSTQGRIPGIEYGSDLGVFIKSIYNWGIGIVGILALAQLVIGGVQYMMSGAVDKTQAAKDRIFNALIGVVMALTSYLIIYTINPELVKVGFELAPLDQSISISTEKITACMTTGELQKYTDNNYTCVSAGASCPEGKGSYTCTPPAKAPKVSSAKVCDSGDGQQVQAYVNNAYKNDPKSTIDCQPDPSSTCSNKSYAAFKCTVQKATK